jgi:hypothetical protein
MAVIAKQFTLDVVKPSDMSSDEVYDMLKALAYYTHNAGESGYSFFVRKKYIVDCINDYKTDFKSNAKWEAEHKKTIEALEKLVLEMKSNTLLVDHEDFEI